MYGYIILRDIPKKAAQLDLSIYDIQGGFRGFALVPPGLHYISVEVNGKMNEGFWCYLKPSSAVVKMYDYKSKKFIDPDPESEEQYRMMALSGAMNKALIPVMQRNSEMAMMWQKLVSFIKEEFFPLKLNKETPMTPPIELTPVELSEWFLTNHKSRYEQAFNETHKGTPESLLAEFQYSFVLFTLQKPDDQGFNRWIHLLQAFYNAGEKSIDSTPEVFTHLSKILIEQLKCIPNDWFDSSNKIFSGIYNMIEDMIDTENNDLIETARLLENSLKSIISN